MVQGYNLPEIYIQYENATNPKEKMLLFNEIKRLESVALKGEKVSGWVQEPTIEILKSQNMNEPTGYAPMGGMPTSAPPLTTGFGGTINFGGDTGNKNVLYIAGGVVALIIAIGVSFNVGRKKSKRRR